LLSVWSAILPACLTDNLAAGGQLRGSFDPPFSAQPGRRLALACRGGARLKEGSLSQRCPGRSMERVLGGYALLDPGLFAASALRWAANRLGSASCWEGLLRSDPLQCRHRPSSPLLHHLFRAWGSCEGAAASSSGTLSSTTLMIHGLRFQKLDAPANCWRSRPHHGWAGLQIITKVVAPFIASPGALMLFSDQHGGPPGIW